ncbi:MAG: sulfatase-like hydrolase/transferase [Verrucomicrobia bacterium]|nr:sulfatase-like hydrolase/transferase [Verrucomicrobiota bacterium]
MHPVRAIVLSIGLTLFSRPFFLGLREEYDVYTERLQDAGYLIGRYGKGVWPSKHTFRGRDSFGERYRSFDEFLMQRKSDEPFCFWYGGQDPHRPYELGIGVKSGIDLEAVEPPACLPDNETVRSDLADYYWEVQRFDREVGEVLAQLEAMGELENTIVVVSGDNGMPFPRAKATLYDLGTRVPLAVRWGSEVKGGRTISDFVSLCDFAPTFLEAAGLAPGKAMTGKSIIPILNSNQSGQVNPDRNFVLTGMEQHVYRNPSRAFRTEDFLYIRNFEPEKWLTGEVEGENPNHDFAVTPWPTGPGAFSYNIDPSPTKQYLRHNRENQEVKELVNLSFRVPPSEELYDLKVDPDQLQNIAAVKAYERILEQQRCRLNVELLKAADPRMEVDGYVTQLIEGWVVRVSEDLRKQKPEETEKTLRLLKAQCQKVIEVIPATAVVYLQSIQLWVSLPKEGRRPRAEFHPSEDWLIENGMQPDKVKGVEFTNTAIFEKEIVRMPMLLLHELAHAYHNLVLGFDHPELLRLYEQAKENGSYQRVERRNHETQMAYAITNHKEYFAECTEAFFGENDFYPFNNIDLKLHDPDMYDLLTDIWIRTYN